jgi:hypothetical protein
MISAKNLSMQQIKGYYKTIIRWGTIYSGQILRHRSHIKSICWTKKTVSLSKHSCPQWNNDSCKCRQACVLMTMRESWESLMWTLIWRTLNLFLKSLWPLSHNHLRSGSKKVIRSKIFSKVLRIQDIQSLETSQRGKRNQKFLSLILFKRRRHPRLTDQIIHSTKHSLFLFQKITAQSEIGASSTRLKQ